MKKLTNALILASLVIASAAVGCSSAPKKEEPVQTAPVVQEKPAENPINLGAASSGRSR